MKSNPHLLIIFLGIIFVSFNLRAPITSVGPVIDLIQAQYNLNSSMAGFITTLPLLAFAIFSPFVAKINHKIGHGLTMFAGLLLIIIGELVRSYTNVYGLFIGTISIGIGIAIGNVLIPSVIKHKFEKNVGSIISIYITGMCIFAALGSGLSIPATEIFGWNTSLAIWVILALLALVIWLPQLRKSENYNNSDDLKLEEIMQSKSIWKSPLAWWVTLYMGTQSLLFYTLITWIPSILIFKDFDSHFSGMMLLLFQLVGLPATLIVPIIADKIKHQKFIATIISLIYLLGIVTLLFAQSTFSVILSMIFIGLGTGGAISLAIGFISLRTPHVKKAAELSGMSQSAGYLFAAVGPILIGFIFDVTKSWTNALLVLIALILLLILFGLKAGRDELTHY
ncbi:CynX/NimT family MFS transporter [Malaciobacter marinus]|uniref:CynX/NimT family MFS transporter n=1 Tax=Malaciobacter marinus TaxID=505249 RepID=UPI000C075680|nr:MULTISPECIES: MFS transporter [Malaciobacter]PHO11688.1 MFS transporter [Malaciobacter marinus]RYA22435.1 MFS transporter [Malaciobacter halophilus]